MKWMLLAVTLLGCTRENPHLIGQRADESCVEAGNCGGRGTYALCTIGFGTPSCSARYLLGDGQSFACTSCDSCNAALASLTKLCATNGGSTNGGSTNGGSTTGASTSTGTTGGSTNSGSTIGGSTNGGSTNGGITSTGTTSGSTNGGSTTGGSTNGGSTTGGTTGPLTPDQMCALLATNTDCTTCCQNNHPEGDAFLNQQVQECICASTSICPDCTKNACAGTAPTSPCLVCLRGQTAPGGVCDGGKICSQDADCVAWRACSRQCAALP
jgi:hypothetical protein